MFAPIALKSKELQQIQNKPLAQEGTMPPWIQKMIQATGTAFLHLVNALTAPRRYLGAKNWSIPGVLIRLPCVAYKHATTKQQRTFAEDLFGTGYHRPIQKILTKDELKPFFKYGCAAAFVHRTKEEWISPLNYTALGKHSFTHDQLQSLPPSIEARTSCLFNPKSQLKVAILQKDKEVIVAFGALGSYETEGVADDMANLKTSGFAGLVGIKPDIYREAEELVAWIKKQPEFQDKEITLSGSCFGGSLASYCALKQDLKAVALNPFPLGAGLQQDIPQKALDNADAHVINITAKGDFYTNSRSRDAIDTIVSAIGIKTPGTFGQRLAIPSAYKKGADTHNYFMGSVMKYMGYDTRTEFKDVPQEFFKDL